MSDQKIQRFAQLALDGVHRSYPYHLTHVVQAPGAIASPQSLTPAFYGCFDWHSAVHGHWLLALTVRHQGSSDFAATCRAALAESLTKEHLKIESEYVSRRPGFERPYGLAWLLMLDAELSLHQDEQAAQWRASLQPLVEVTVSHLSSWLPKLTYPVRSGTHNQTAFAMALAFDWATLVDCEAMVNLIKDRAMVYFADDRDYALHLEPGGEDFLSPSLSAAWLMTRILKEDAFDDWLDRTMPGLGRDFVFEPALPSDRSDGRLCHLDGLNLSRAWMLAAIAVAIGTEDPRAAQLQASSHSHQAAGMEGLQSGHYSGSHWLGTFAAYLLYS